MRTLDQYTQEEIDAVVERFFPEEHYPRDYLTLTDDDKARLMGTMNGALIVASMRFVKIGWSRFIVVAIVVLLALLVAGVLS